MYCSNLKEYGRKCPICGELHEKIILTNGVWDCPNCGKMFCSPEETIEIYNLSCIEKNREVFINYVQEKMRKTNQPVNISIKLLKEILKEKGLL